MVLEIIIIGAGVAGLSTALSLAPSGHNIRLYERKLDFDHEGWGLLIHPPATTIFRKWGLTTNILESIEIDTNFRRRLADLGLLQDQDVVKLRKDLGVESPVLVQDRADLHVALRTKLKEYPNVSWHLGFEITRVLPSGVIELANGAVDSADLIVGADGIHSKAIDCIPRPRHQNYINSATRLPFRLNNCVVDVDLATKDPMVAEYLATIDFHHGFGNYVSGDEGPSRGPKGPFTASMMLFLPIRQSRMINLCLGRPDQSVVSDDGGPWTRSLSFEQFYNEAHCKQISPILQRLVRLARHFERWTLATRDCPTSFVTDKVVLVGDAAHLTSPSTGAGACLGVEDGVVLATLLQTATVENLAKRLQLYNTLRYERCLIVKYYGDSLRPENTGNSAEMLDYLVPGAKLPAPNDFFRYLWVYDPLKAAREALEGDHCSERCKTMTREKFSDIDPFWSRSLLGATMDWIRSLLCMGDYESL